jgi:FkbM family methyltransferase
MNDKSAVPSRESSARSSRSRETAARLGEMAREMISDLKRPREFYLKLKRWRQLFYFLRRPRETFWEQVTGVIHVGANVGQERDFYATRDLNVLWVEPIPEVFSRLNEYIASVPKQRALCCLVTDADDKEYPFHISNNDGQCSSILVREQHKAVFSGVSFTETITLKSVTLSSLVKRERIDLAQYDALVMDTQGSELLVLKGAVDILPAFRFIKTEVPDFAAYQNCCQLPDMDDFMRSHAYRRVVTHRWASKPGVGSWFHVTYAKVA